MRTIAFILATSILLLTPSGVFAADKYSGTPATRAEFEKVQQEMRPGKYADAITSLEGIIKRDPNFAPAYDSLLFAKFMEIMYSGKATTEAEKTAQSKKLHDQIMAKYEALSKENPKNPIYPWVIAQTYNEASPTLQEQYCQKSVDISPDFTPGYQCLAGIAMLRGDSVPAAAYFRKVIEANPNNPDELLQYLYFVQPDPVEFRKAAFDVGNKFPNTQQAADALYRYADAQTEPEARQKAMEDVVARYSPARFDSASQAENELFGDYDKTDPAKALALAHNMLKQLPNDETWKRNAAYADAMAEATQKVNSGDARAALAILGKVKLPGLVFGKTRLQLLQSRAKSASGDLGGAYANLLNDVATHPTDKTQAALYVYGKQLNKTAQQVDAEVWTLRSAAAKPAIPFSLESFLTGKQVSLQDYKGHVVLVDFFYPNCSPCMRSFPYMQNLLTKFKDRGVAVLAINGMEGQAPFVLPLLKSKRVGFIPLKGNAKWCSDVYHVRGYPTTFLVGADGRVYFKPHVYDHAEQRTTELEIEALLKAAEANK